MPKMKKTLAALFLALLVPAVLKAQALMAHDPLDKVIAVVEDDVILKSELDRAVSNILTQYQGRGTQLPPREILERQVLERLVMIRLQIARASGTGIRVSDAEVDQAIATRPSPSSLPRRARRPTRCARRSRTASTSPRRRSATPRASRRSRAATWAGAVSTRCRACSRTSSPA